MNEELWEKAVEATEKAFNALKEGDLPELDMLCASHAVMRVKDTLDVVRCEQYKHEHGRDDWMKKKELS